MAAYIVMTLFLPDETARETQHTVRIRTAVVGLQVIRMKNLPSGKTAKVRTILAKLDGLAIAARN
jgi:hypothetical protein